MTSDLHPISAREKLSMIGRVLYNAEPKSLWERDTKILPGPFRKARRRYRDFAQAYIAPHALSADRSPEAFDLKALFIESGRHGFQTEFMPWPWGTFNLRFLRHSLLLATALKAEEFCAACGGIGLSLLAHELGIAPLFISGDLRAYFIGLGTIYKQIKMGEPAIGAFAITEPSAGSDVEDTEGARVAKLGCRYEKVEGGFIINGRKVFISNGAVAKWITLFAAPKGEGIESWTCFLVDNSMKGFSIGRSEKKMGQRAADASELVLEDMFVPDNRVVGKIGAGWAINRNVLNYSRPIVGAMAMGIARGAFEHTLAFCRENQLSNRPLIDYQDVQLALADMMIKVTAMRATVWQTVRNHFPYQGAGATAKVFCADSAWDVCNRAMELMGDHGMLHNNHAEKAARDARLTQIYEGTNQINRLALFESQQGAEF